MQSNIEVWSDIWIDNEGRPWTDPKDWINAIMHYTPVDSTITLYRGGCVVKDSAQKRLATLRRKRRKGKPGEGGGYFTSYKYMLNVWRVLLYAK